MKWKGIQKVVTCAYNNVNWKDKRSGYGKYEAVGEA